MTTTATNTDDSHDYLPFLHAHREHFSRTIEGVKALFTTDAADLFATFLANLPPDQRQHHTCQACRHFVERFGDLVTIDEAGHTTPAMWGAAPGIYSDAFAACYRLVAKAKVTGVFLSSEPVWGQPVTGEWHHMAVMPPPALLFRKSALLTAGQKMAEKREEYAMLSRGLAEFSADLVTKARTILDAEALYRTEKVQGPAKWLAELHAAREAAKGKAARENVTWRAVATAPPGFCHVRSTMIGTLLADLAEGLPFEAVKARFAEKMHPLQYQRPTAAPKAGAIAQAEKVVAELQSAGAFARRFARLDEIEKLWAPRTPEAKPAEPGAVFGHLTPKGKAPASQLDLPAQTMTWDKFARTVLPTSTEIEFYAPHGPANFVALVTAADPAAPPILQWDSAEQRNPVSWYVYNGGSVPSQWNLAAGTWIKVTAVTLLPSMWHAPEKHTHQGAGVILVLDGCRDLRARGAGAGLFPEIMKSEYHWIRSVIEAHSRSLTIAGLDEASACGIDLRKGDRWSCRVRVTTAGARALYDLDRWD